MNVLFANLPEIIGGGAWTWVVWFSTSKFYKWKYKK